MIWRTKMQARFQIGLTFGPPSKVDLKGAGLKRVKENGWKRMNEMWCDVMTLGTRIGRGPALEQVPVLGFRQLGFGSSSTVLEELHGTRSEGEKQQ